MSEENPFQSMLDDNKEERKPAQPGVEQDLTQPEVQELKNETPSPEQTAGNAGAKSSDGNGADNNGMNLDFLLDIPLTVKVEVGRTRMLLNDLLQLGQGSVVELNKLVGEPFEILVNEKLIAKGEVVVINERFGIRLTEISSPMERVRSLS